MYHLSLTHSVFLSLFSLCLSLSLSLSLSPFTCKLRTLNSLLILISKMSLFNLYISHVGHFTFHSSSRSRLDDVALTCLCSAFAASSSCSSWIDGTTFTSISPMSFVHVLASSQMARSSSQHKSEKAKSEKETHTQA